MWLQNKANPTDVRVLIPRTCAYITSQGERECAGTIRLKMLRWEGYPGTPRGLHLITGVFTREKACCQGQKLRQRNRSRNDGFEKGERPRGQGMRYL